MTREREKERKGGGSEEEKEGGDCRGRQTDKSASRTKGCWSQGSDRASSHVCRTIQGPEQIG